MRLQNRPAFFLLALALLVSSLFSQTAQAAYTYTYTLVDQNFNSLSSLVSGDIINLNQLTRMNVVASNPGATKFSFEKIAASSLYWQVYYNIPGYKTSTTQSPAPFDVFVKSSSSANTYLDLATLYSQGYQVFTFQAKDSRYSGWDPFYFLTAYSGDLCTLVQSGNANGPVCKNGGYCIAQLVGSSCGCPANFNGNDDCSACTTGYNGTNCATCSAGYFGWNCQACPSCGVHGSCNQGVNGNGQCSCQARWAGATCSQCATGFSGANCDQCAAGYYGPNCLPCPSCGAKGTCNATITGNGQCVCAAGWVSWGGGYCNACADGYYGASCLACPNCGSKGSCDQGGSGDTGGTGVCNCQQGWTSANGGNCNACADGYFGASCSACPSCGAHGSCDQGVVGDIGGTGSCVCAPGWAHWGGGYCNVCADGYFGASCTACPSCGSKGSCDQGVAGDLAGTGVCVCAAGWVSYGGGSCNACAAGFWGANCTACPSCGHGICNEGSVGDTGGTGTCTCSAGWVSYGGGVCNACADGYYGSNCAACPNCGSHGTCSQGVAGDTAGTGTCTCAAGWVSYNGGNCNACADGYFGATCTACPNCGAHGTCDQGVAGDTAGTGTCTCAAGWVSYNGGSCNACADGFFGASCAACPSCGAHGSCSQGVAGDTAGSGQCICTLGWGGASCDVCATGFTGASCNQCSPGFYGPSCTACPACNSHSSCSDGKTGNGTCVCAPTFTSSPGNLCDVCITGFTGSDCSQCLANRYGVNCAPCPSCNHGTCLAGITGSGACNCSTGWVLDGSGSCTQCAAGYYSNACLPCQNCGPHGTCNSGFSANGQCTCATGWASDNGNCNVCAPGYFGPDCQACPGCGHGSCSDGLAGNGNCTCAFPWISANGGTCNVCSQGFTGTSCNQCVDGNYPDCFVAIPCPGGCRGHGACNFRTGQCSCDVGFVNFDCGTCVLNDLDTFPACTAGILCSQNCSYHGHCDTNVGACTCYPGFQGATCNSCQPGYESYPNCYYVLTCPLNCSAHGSCDDHSGECSCAPPYGGPDCASCLPGYASYPTCYEILSCPNDCSGHGDCQDWNGTCLCQPSYIGDDCATQLFCYSEPCLNGATCTEVPAEQTFSCACTEDFTGDTCEYSLLTPVVDSVAPLVAALSGTNLTVSGLHFQAPLTVAMSFNSQALGSTTVLTITPPNRKRSVQTFVFQTPVTTTRGYVTLTFTNPSGTSATFEGLFLTSDCAQPGSFASAGNCTACPSHAVCPGGEIIWPQPGYWSPDTLSPPLACPPPTSRCLGGADSACADGYQGELCAFCEPEFQTDETGACVPCPAYGCGSQLNLGPSTAFFFICLAVVIVCLISILLYKNFSLIRQRLTKKSLNKRISQRLRKTEYASEHDMSYVAHPRASVDESVDEYTHLQQPTYEDNVPMSFDQRAYAEPPYWSAAPAANPGYIPIQVPLFDAEAICLDRTLRSIPARDNLYSQILKISRSDLAFARIAHQVTKKVLREHQHQIFVYDASGETTGISNELEIQKLVDRYIDESAWRVVGALNAITKKGTFGKSAFQRQQFDLPYAIQISDDRGPKPAMENRWFVQLFANELCGFGLNPNISVMGIYDGFGGTEAAEYVARHLHVNLLRNENFKRNPQAAFYEAFLQTNEGFGHIVQSNRLPDVVGCTAVLSMIRGEELWVSWVGDCQAVLFKTDGQYICFCDPHTPSNDLERERVEALGGIITEKAGQHRLGGIYPITRAFGCTRQRKVITAEPDVIAYDLQGEEQYLVMANGPFWNVMSSQAVSTFLAQFRGTSTSGIADALVQCARSLGCVDNVTVSVLGFSNDK